MKVIFSIFLFFAFFGSPQTPGENQTFNRERTFDVQHYLIKLNFNRQKKIVYSDSTITIKPLNEDIQTIELDAQKFNIESITLTPSGKQLEYQQKNGKLIINLDRIYKPEENFSINFKYSVLKPKKGIYFIDPEIRRGKITRPAQVYTQGESEETHYWLPSFDFPDDKATTEQIITVKKGETAIGNGELLNRTVNDNGSITYHYKMSVPHSLYLTSFVIGTYEKITENYKDIPLSYYVYPGQKSIVKNAFGKTKDMFRIYEELTGIPYPYNKYDQTMVADFQFGGMENITATTMADSEIMFAKFPFARGLVEDLVSHELAHSWFGNLVTCRNWAELWLNESFATYMEAAFREKMYGKSEYLRKIESDAAEFFIYASLRENDQHGLFNQSANPKNDDTMFTTITYQKGSAVIHTLREEIGDKNFWTAINIYLNRFKYKNVETRDLQNVMEEASGKDLDWFFKQWVYGNKFPVLKINQSYSKSKKLLTLEITQVHKVDKLTPEAFILPMDLEINMSGKNKSTQIQIKENVQKIEIPVDEKPFQITFDKNYKIPLKDISLSKLLLTD